MLTSLARFMPLDGGLVLVAGDHTKGVVFAIVVRGGDENDALDVVEAKAFQSTNDNKGSWTLLSCPAVVVGESLLLRRSFLEVLTHETLSWKEVLLVVFVMFLSLGCQNKYNRESLPLAPLSKIMPTVSRCWKKDSDQDLTIPLDGHDGDVGCEGHIFLKILGSVDASNKWFLVVFQTSTGIMAPSVEPHIVYKWMSHVTTELNKARFSNTRNPQTTHNCTSFPRKSEL